MDTVYADGRGGQGLDVEVSREDGTTVGFVQLETSEASEGDDWRVVAYSAFD